MTLRSRNRRTPRHASRRESFERPLFLRSGSAAANANTTILSEPCLLFRASLVALSTSDGYALIRDQNSTGTIREVLAVDASSLRADHVDYDWRTPLYMPEGIHLTISAAGSVLVCTVSYVELDEVPWLGNLDDYRLDGSFMGRHSGSRIFRTEGGANGDIGPNVGATPPPGGGVISGGPVT